MQRAIVSYSDIADPQPSEPLPIASTSNGTTQPPPAKRRKSKGGKGNSHATHSTGEYGPPGESRDLTHEEIWDDSALIDAWNAATEEYEVLNGADKKWKHEPLHKSALWYTSLPETTSNDNKTNTENDSTPLDFDSYVPEYPSGITADGQNDDSPNAQRELQPPSFGFPPMPDASAVSPEVALQNAYGAWYWAGYWSGVYQTMNANKSPTMPEATAATSNDAELDESVIMDLEDVVEDGEV